MRTYKVLNRKGIEITLVIPDEERNAGDESIIAKRLNDFFQIRKDRNIKKRNEILLRSIFLEVIGIACMFVANFISQYTIEYFKDFMLIPSWFFVWNGLEKYFDHRKILDKKIKYYSFISKSRIRFESIQ